MKQHILSIIVNNRYGVLSRVAGAFNRLGHNIDSFSSGQVRRDGSFCLTIVVEGEATDIDLIKRQLERLVDVKSVEDIEMNQVEVHEMALVKIRRNGDHGTRLDMVAASFNAEFVTDNKEIAVLRLSGKPVWIEAFLERMDEFDVISSSRSGIVAV